jgi:hypothetical protein
MLKFEHPKCVSTKKSTDVLFCNGTKCYTLLSLVLSMTDYGGNGKQKICRKHMVDGVNGIQRKLGGQSKNLIIHTATHTDPKDYQYMSRTID